MTRGTGAAIALAGLAAACLALALAGRPWWLALAPPLKTLAQADAQATQLEAQLQAMQGLQAQAKATALVRRELDLQLPSPPDPFVATSQIITAGDPRAAAVHRVITVLEQQRRFSED